MDQLDAIAAAGLVSSATLAALVGMLKRKHLITAQDEREIYEHALLLLEQGQANGPPDVVDVYAAAREVIEEQLRG